MVWLDEIERERGMTEGSATYDTLGNIAEQAWQEGMQDFGSAVRKTNELGPEQQEWLYRSPAENVSRLNKESAQTGVYGFSYVRDVPEDIPGMTTKVYEIPNDPHGGMYVGYESYTQTYEKAQQAYQESVQSGHVNAKDEQAYQDATRNYEAQKAGYKNYLDEHPEAPDYLSSTNPVQAYTSYEGPRRQQESFYQQEVEQAGASVSMDDVTNKMNEGFVGSTMAKNAGMEGQYAKEHQIQFGSPNDEHSYGVRVMEGIDQDTIDYMKDFESGGTLPEIKGQKGTDEYGRSVAERMVEIDKELQSRDSNYESMFPEHMQYYSEGENPTAIPGMTVVAMKIEGAPGYLAGYESYDATYQHTMSELDTKQKELNDSSASDMEKTKQQETLQQQYDSANQMYDSQKQQYDAYVQEHPGNAFMDSKSPVDSFHAFQEKLPPQQRARDKMQGLVDLLKEGWENLKEWGAKFFKADPAPGELNEQQAMQQSANYWNQRASLEPSNPEFQQRANEVNQQMVQASMEQEPVAGSNPFRDIVTQGTAMDTSYQMQNTMSYQPYDPPVYGSTGNQMLDELSHGSTDSVDSMMRQMADSGDRGFDASMYTGAQETVLDRDAGVTRSQEMQREGASKGNSRRSELLERTAQLEAQLQQNGAAQQQADMGFSMRR